MLKSLYSGIAGLQSHQVAMDVESNNIANVNTTGYKYSRANFSDLLAQTTSIATAPQGALGGKNAIQIGLGSTISSTTRIFAQGSVQQSDKNTDVAIQGDGFFIVSPDAGNSYKYTRAGDFKFDASGNFVDNNGYITQGWLRDETGKVDSTAPIQNINIAPGLTTPASPTTDVRLKANLNSGPTVTSSSPAYEVKSGIPPSVAVAGSPDAIDAAGNPINSGDLGVMFNGKGEAFSLQANQGIWASFQSAQTKGSTVIDTIVKTFSRPPVAGDTVSVDVNGLTYSGATYADLKTAVEAGAAAIVTISGNELTFTPNPAGSIMNISNLANNNNSNTGIVSVSSTVHELDFTVYLDDGTTKRMTTSGATGDETAAQNANRYVSAINAQRSTTGITASYDTVNNKINLLNDNSDANASHNIKIASGGINSGLNGATQAVVTAYKYQYNPSGSSAIANTDKTFKTMADLRYAMEVQARSVPVILPATVSYTVAAGNGANEAANFTIAGIPITVAAGGQTTENNVVTFGALNPGETLTIGGLTLTDDGTGATAAEVAAAFASVADGGVGNPGVGAFTGALTGWSSAALVGTTVTFTSSTASTDVSNLTITGSGAGTSLVKTDGKGPTTANDNGAIYAKAINKAGIPGVTATYIAGSLTISNANSANIAIAGGSFGVSGVTAGTIASATTGNGNSIPNESNIEITVNKDGKFEIINPGASPDGDYDINLKITGLKSVTNGITENTRFTTSMTALNTILPAGSTGKAFSQSFRAATHSSSLDVFDSLGSKHTLKIELRKTALDAATGSTWSMKVSIPLPASIDTLAPTNEKTGSIRFNNDGSLANYDPPNLSFSGNNGSAPNQQINLSFGTPAAFDGMTSFDSASKTTELQQDGFTGGDLVGIRIDQSGTVVGTFSNQHQFALAQIAMAKFTNNEGLSTEGGNTYVQTANSGDPIIGSAATSGRGLIRSSALEASNVDLSRALTQLIIIQRGYQANGKTITTSDQLLQTLIGLKN